MLIFRPINATASGDNVILPGSVYGNKKVMVLSYVLISSAPCVVTWKSGASTALSGGMSLQSSGGCSHTANYLAPGQPLGAFQTNAGDDLILNVSGAATVGGHISLYVMTA